MGATDQPFSITSKYLEEGGAEHLVTIRATTVEVFTARLQEAAQVFPAAGLTPAQGTVATVTPATPPKNGRPPPPTSVAQARGQVTRAEQGAAATANVRKQHQAQAQEDADQPCCPVHRRSDPSQYGGLYCPMPAADGNGFCKWTWKPGKAATN